MICHQVKREREISSVVLRKVGQLFPDLCKRKVLTIYVVLLRKAVQVRIKFCLLLVPSYCSCVIVRLLERRFYFH